MHVLAACGVIYLLLLILIVGGALFDASERGFNPPRFFVTAIFGPILATVFAASYLAPIGVAYVRRHRNLIPIAIVDICLGWVFIGWIGALAWSFTDSARE